MKNYRQFFASLCFGVLKKTTNTVLNSALGKLVCLVFILCFYPFIPAGAEPVLKPSGEGEKVAAVNGVSTFNEIAVQDNSAGNSFVSLFNGRDLTGWSYRTKVEENIVVEPFESRTESADGRYMAKDSMLTINPWDESKGPHWVNLWSLKELTGDFMLTIEFRASVNADSGIFLKGKQLQCRDYLVAGPYRDLKKYKPQDWNKIEVVVKNNIARCTCNGEILEEALQVPPKDSIGLEADRGRMDYRNIFIKEL